MKDFTLPANIKQIGSIGDGLRIYMEDYVCTFLQSYAEGAGFEERLAFLVGRQMVIDGQQFLFIGGAIYGRFCEKHEGHLRFTEKSAEYAEEMLEEFFPGMEIVGWMQSQPSYGTYLNQYYAAYHLRQFRKAFQVMFVADPLERTNAFYAANPVAMTPADRMAEISGYFIYYEKNTNMHEYMLVNKSVEYTAKPPTLVELTPVEYATAEEKDDEAKVFGREKEAEPQVGGYEDYFDSESERTGMDGRFALGGPPHREPEEIIRRHRAAKEKRRGNMAEQKRAMNLLAGLCAVLFVVSFIMGVGLIRNQDRIDNMDRQIDQLTLALRNHMAVATGAGELAPVFAEADVPAVEASLPGAVPIETPVPTPAEVVAEPVPTATPEPAPAPIATPTADAVVNDAVAIADEESALIPPVPETYTIQPGDSLLGIALYFFNDANRVNEILLLNGLEDPDLIVAGRTIVLPRR